MKRILLITTLALFMFGCEESNQGIVGWHNELNVDGLKSSYKIIEIDNCEYIVYDAGEGYAGFGFMAHKGNCKNH